MESHTHARELRLEVPQNYLVPIPDDPEITASLFDLLAYQEPLTWALTYEEPG